MKKQSDILLLSSAYLPPAEYFAWMLKYSEARIEQHETYPKQTYRNRCYIYSEKGKMALIIPVIKVDGNQTKTKDVRIFYRERWQLNHWRAIESAYISSPYFIYYRDELEPFYKEAHDNLLNFNTQLTMLLCELLGIDVNINFTREYLKNPANCTDMRTLINPKKEPTLNVFPGYTQVFGDRHGFIPNLGIIDLLFNLGPETKSYLEKLNQ